MGKLFTFFWGLIWLVPILLAGLGYAFSSRLSRGRWAVHSLIFAAMLLVLPAAIYLQGVIDPTTIEGPGPADGMIVQLYLVVMVVSALYYAAAAWVIYRKHNPV
jgi:hypothetical protein